MSRTQLAARPEGASVRRTGAYFCLPEYHVQEDFRLLLLRSFVRTIPSEGVVNRVVKLFIMNCESDRVVRVTVLFFLTPRCIRVQDSFCIPASAHKMYSAYLHQPQSVVVDAGIMGQIKVKTRGNMSRFQR